MQGTIPSLPATPHSALHNTTVAWHNLITGQRFVQYARDVLLQRHICSTAVALHGFGSDRPETPQFAGAVRGLPTFGGARRPGSSAMRSWQVCIWRIGA